MSRAEVARRAVFLDRDGTLNAEVGFVTAPAALRILPGVVPALRRLRAAGFLLVVVTNQSGIARGLYSEATLAAIHARLHRELEGMPLAYLHCPHLPEAEGPYGGVCSCRKPAAGLLHAARELLELDFAGSFAIGDSARDLLPARDLPMRTVLVKSGKEWRQQLQLLAAQQFAADAVVDDIAAAATWVLQQPAVR